MFSTARDPSSADAQYADIVTVRPVGQTLAKSAIDEAGDFIFIPHDVPHQPFNSSDSEPAQASVARNDANEPESVVHYDPGAPHEHAMPLAWEPHG